MKKGMKKGIEKGIEKGILKTAKNMLLLNMSIDDIVKVTGLSFEQVKKLKAD